MFFMINVVTPQIPARVSKPFYKLVDISRSDALDLGYLDVIRHQVRYLTRPLLFQLSSPKKILRLSAPIYSSFKMSQTVVDVITQLR
jgi:hypothetical protein